MEDVDFACDSMVDVFSSKIWEHIIAGIYGSVLDMREKILDFLMTKDNHDDNDDDEADI